MFHGHNFNLQKIDVLFFQVPGRMGLLVTLYLISYNVYGSLKAPKNRGFSYIELWMIGHQNVIFIAILEYGLVLIWKKFYSKSMPNIVEVLEPSVQDSMLEDDDMTLNEKIKRLDMISFFILIFLMILFNLYYWTVA